MEAHLNAHMEPGAISITQDDDELVRVALLKPGYQLDLYPGGSQGIARILGFRPFRLPAEGVFKEVSARLGNNKFVYAHFDDKIHIDAARQIFTYIAWKCVDKQADSRCLDGHAETYRIQLDVGSHSPTKLLQHIQASARKNGHDDLFDFVGDPATWGTRVHIRVPRTAGRVLLLTRFQSDILGGMPRAMPEASTSVYYLGGLPNEVSERAGTNLVRYRYVAGAADACIDPGHPNCEFQVDVSKFSDAGAGIQSLSAVQDAIRRGLIHNHDHTFEYALELYIDANDFVVLEIRREGIQLLNATNSIHRYLGFDDGDLPLAGKSRARASHARPLVSDHLASGSCANGVCACGANGSLAVCFDSSRSAQVLNSHNCVCEPVLAADNMMDFEAPEMWGRTLINEVVFPDGLYSTARELNGVMSSHFSQQTLPYYSEQVAPPIYFLKEEYGNDNTPVEMGLTVGHPSEQESMRLCVL